MKYEAIYAKNNEGIVIFPTNIDEADGLVTFPYKNEELTIHITDKHDHTLDAVLSGTLNK